MRRSFLPIAAVLFGLLTVMSSCRYKDLCYDHHHDPSYNFYLKLTLNLELDVDVEVSEEDHTKINIPSYLVVGFYDTKTGAMRSMEYVESYGGPLHVGPGTYDMVIWSFDTEWTQVRGEGNKNELEAYTSDITKIKAPLFELAGPRDSTTAPGPIIYTPDHLLVTRKQVVIPEFSFEEQVITIEATAETVVETYAFEIANIKGIEYVASVDAFITNQARSSFFGRGEVNAEPATIYFPMQVDRKAGSFKSSFNTFGKLPGESKSYLNIVMTDTEGTPHTLITDVTDQFSDTTHTIVVQDSIDIPEPEGMGGGIAPTVDEWEEENHDVPIG